VPWPALPKQWQARAFPDRTVVTVKTARTPSAAPSPSPLPEGTASSATRTSSTTITAYATGPRQPAGMR
jgi:hypothetical protein